ncbi:Serine-threonine/tyrosine-protein kinase, catalytic domain [Dillenia turbinata]|uniref:Serine-threonine/tyrosine-protein kinase, catalytic domain n=1 Tax=Dillenia turbinata TaxID=194707 RepID=A0AAN8V3F3_9MAGN
MLWNHSRTGSSVGSEMGANTGRWISPDFLQHGIASEKVDIFAFGVILLELISAKEDNEGNYLKASIGFLGGVAGEGGCFEQLRNFMAQAIHGRCPESSCQNGVMEALSYLPSFVSFCYIYICFCHDDEILSV